MRQEAFPDYSSYTKQPNGAFIFTNKSAHPANKAPLQLAKWPLLHRHATRRFLGKADKLVCTQEALETKHALRNIALVRAAEGDPGTTFKCALFQHPSASGYVWIKTTSE